MTFTPNRWGPFVEPADTMPPELPTDAELDAVVLAAGFTSCEGYTYVRRQEVPPTTER